MSSKIMCVCPKCNHTFKTNSVRDNILKLLKKTKSVTELKNELKEIASFGTISYHLKQLRNKGIIERDKRKHTRGRKTYYYLKNG